jgi:hypothetical protein
VELPITYATSVEFAEEFDNVMSSECSCKYDRTCCNEQGSTEGFWIPHQLCWKYVNEVFSPLSIANTYTEYWVHDLCSLQRS